MATPKIDMKPTAAEMLKFVPVKQQRPHAAQAQGHHVREHQQRVHQIVEGQIEQHENRRQRQRNDKQQTMLGLLHFLKFAAPFGMVGSMEQMGGLLLRLGDASGQIAAAHAELDGDEALALLAVNRRGAGTQELAVRVGHRRRR